MHLCEILVEKTYLVSNLKLFCNKNTFYCYCIIKIKINIIDDIIE